MIQIRKSLNNKVFGRLVLGLILEAQYHRLKYLGYFISVIFGIIFFANSILFSCNFRLVTELYAISLSFSAFPSVVKLNMGNLKFAYYSISFAIFIFTLRYKVDFKNFSNLILFAVNNGSNTITRNSIQSSITVPFEQTFRSLDNRPPTDNTPEQEEFNFCGCGYPDHLLVPKGLQGEGLQAELFVMITDFQSDRVNLISFRISILIPSFLEDERYAIQLSEKRNVKFYTTSVCIRHRDYI